MISGFSSEFGWLVKKLILLAQAPFPPAPFSPFFSSVATFSHRRSARIKKLIQRKLLGAPKNLGVDILPDPVGHFGAPLLPFWILQAIRRCGWWASAPFAARLVFTGCPKKRGISEWFHVCFIAHSIWNLVYPFLIYLKIEFCMFMPSTKVFLSNIGEMRNLFSINRFVCYNI